MGVRVLNGYRTAMDWYGLFHVKRVASAKLGYSGPLLRLGNGLLAATLALHST